MKIKRNSGYSEPTAKLYIDSHESIYSLSNELIAQVKWVDQKPTDEIIGYQAWFIGENTEPFKVKFTDRISLPPKFTKVKFQTLEECEVGNNVYFRAKGIEVGK